VLADEFRFETSSGAFLERAEALLAKFDETDDAALLIYAALELRNGIEARLWEYINFQAPGTVSRREHKAKVLLRALRENAFQTQASSTSTIKWHFEGETVEKRGPMCPQRIASWRCTAGLATTCTPHCSMKTHRFGLVLREQRGSRRSLTFGATWAQ
jgi:hypothetical protein